MAENNDSGLNERELDGESGFSTAAEQQAPATDKEKTEENAPHSETFTPENDDALEAGFGLATTIEDDSQEKKAKDKADAEAEATAKELEQQAHDNLNDFLKALATTYKIDVADFDSMTMPDGKTPAKPLLQTFKTVSFERKNLVGARTLVAKKKNGSGAEITIKHDKKTGGPRIATQGLTMEKALEMAVLAAANPKMQKHGVTLFGSAEQQQILAAAAATIGLKVAGEAPAISDELKAQAVSTFQSMNWDSSAQSPEKTAPEEEPDATAAEETIEDTTKETAEESLEDTAQETVEEKAEVTTEEATEAAVETAQGEADTTAEEVSAEEKTEEAHNDDDAAVAKAKDLLKRSFVLQGYQELSDEQINQYWNEELSEDHKKNILDNLDNFDKEISENEQEAKEHAEKLKTLETLSYDDLEKHLETLESETPAAERLTKINELLDGSVAIKHVDVPESIDRKEAWNNLNADDRLYFVETPGEAAKTIAHIESYRDISLDKIKEDSAELHEQLTNDLLQKEGANKENILSRWDGFSPIEKSQAVNFAQRAIQQRQAQELQQKLVKPLSEQDEATKNYFGKMYATEDGPATEEQLEENWKNMPVDQKQYIHQQAAFMASFEAMQNEAAASEKPEIAETTAKADKEPETNEQTETNEQPEVKDKTSPPSLSTAFNELSEEGREMLIAEAKKHGKLPMNEDIYNAVAKAVLDSTEHNGTVQFSKVKRAYHEAAGLSSDDENRPRDKRVAKNPSAITGAKIIQEVMAKEGLLTKKGNRHYEINKNRNAPGGGTP